SKYLLYSVYSQIIFLLLMSPLAIFDYRHGWQNFEAIKTYFTVRQTTVSAKPWSSLPNLWPLFEQINTRLLAGRSETVGAWISILLLFFLTVFFYKKLKERRPVLTKEPMLLLVVWYGISLVGLGIYKQHIYDHYFG